MAFVAVLGATGAVAACLVWGHFRDERAGDAVVPPSASGMGLADRQAGFRSGLQFTCARPWGPLCFSQPARYRRHFKLPHSPAARGRSSSLFPRRPGAPPRPALPCSRRLLALAARIPSARCARVGSWRRAANDPLQRGGAPHIPPPAGTWRREGISLIILGSSITASVSALSLVRHRQTATRPGTTTTGACTNRGLVGSHQIRTTILRL